MDQAQPAAALGGDQRLFELLGGLGARGPAAEGLGQRGEIGIDELGGEIRAGNSRS